MLTIIENKYQNGYIDALNKKIKQYNTAQQQRSKAELLQLLNEINHIHMDTKKMYIDNNNDWLKFREYEEILNFPGIGSELETLKLPNAQGATAENILTQELRGIRRLPTVQQWEQLPNKNTKSVLEDLKQVDELLTRMPSPPSEQQANEYFYALKDFKNTILNKLSYELTDNTDRKYFTSLLHSVNNEIELIKPLILSETKRNKKIDRVSKTDLVKELSELSPGKMDQLTDLLKDCNAINPGPPTKEDIAEIIPSIKNLDIKKLGGENNINWKISDEESGLDLVMQVELSSYNQKLIEKLERSSTNEYLTIPFFSSATLYEGMFGIVVTEFCSDGDLRHEREVTLQNATPEDILKKATLRIQDLTNFCQGSLKNGIINTDIKLTNFLINDGNLVIADKKGFGKIDPDGNVAKKGLDTSKVYTPPEMNENNPINAEAFMCYQIGLALYEYIVLPDAPKDIDKPYWSAQPLQFDNPVFKTDTGTQLKKLLTQMLDPNPIARPTLNEVQTKLQQVYPGNINQMAQEKNNRHEISVSYKYRTRDSESGRAHEIQVEGSQFQQLKDRFKNLRGDTLKTSILDDIKSKIENTNSEGDLKKLKDNFEQSDEYQVLNTAQGKTTQFVQKYKLFKLNTTSIDTLNEMFEKQEDYLKNRPIPG